MAWGLAAIALIPALLLLGAVAMNRPMLFDPPGPVQRLMIYFRYHAAETTQDPVLPELRIRKYGLPHDEAIRVVEHTLKELPRWKVKDVERGLGAFQASVTSPIWGYTDDVAILVTPLAERESEIYLHSASRRGRGDFGANRRHILEFYEAFEKKVEIQP
jgi:uncharacterized protein (DUF1499 family)